jgi:hypothetical protein
MYCSIIKFRRVGGFRHHPNLSLWVTVNSDFVHSLNWNDDVASPYYNVWKLSEQFLNLMNREVHHYSHVRARPLNEYMDPQNITEI